MICGEIRRFLRDDGLIKVSRSLKELSCKSMKARETMRNRLGREPTVEELAEELGVDREEIVQAMESGAEVESLYMPVHQKEGKEIRLMDKLEESRGQEERILDNVLLAQLMDGLKPEERQLIWMRYFADRTQTEVGKTLGISQVQVSRLEKKILQSLRKGFT